MESFFDFKVIDKDVAKNMHPQILAFIGDGVHSLFVRHKLGIEHDLQIKHLHAKTASFVNAVSQSSVIEKLLPMLDEVEAQVYKRARNYKSTNSAKHASPIEYKRATGLEAVLGYLYVSGQADRLNSFLNQISEQQ